MCEDEEHRDREKSVDKVYKAEMKQQFQMTFERKMIECANKYIDDGFDYTGEKIDVKYILKYFKENT